MGKTIQVTVWNEYRVEQYKAHVAEIYPSGMHGAIAARLQEEPDIEARTATLEEPEHGLTDEVLANTDVLTWWGHDLHNQVKDEVVSKICERVIDDGMGLILLHSSHFSKVFKRLLGTTGRLKYPPLGVEHRFELIWVLEPSHPIAAGLGECIELPEEMYGERFDIPTPDTLVLVSWFPSGEVFRSGCCFTRGNGKIFYFRPGHDEFPTYHNPEIQQVIVNAVRWAAPSGGPRPAYGKTPGYLAGRAES